MKKLFAYAITLITIVFMAGPQDAQAQRIDLAPSLGYGFRVLNQVGDPGTISIGGQLHIYVREGYKRTGDDGQPKRLSLIINPAFDYYLFDINGMAGFQLDANALLSVGRRASTITPYAGLGLGLSIVTGDEDPTVGDLCPSPQRPGPCLISETQSGTAIGLNVLGGILWGRRSPRIITQLRYSIGSHELHQDNDGSASSGLQFHGGVIFNLQN